jgi:FkbM family methyltransferase
MLTPLKTMVVQMLDRVGYCLARNDADLRRLCRLLAHHGVDLVLDVGANLGQFALELRRLGFPGKIVSFEPMSEIFTRLQRNALEDPAWTCLNLALGNTSGKALIHISGTHASSSLLPMKSRHVELVPQSRTVGQETIQMETLDALFPQIAHGFHKVFLKIDTQGYEWQVLEGAVETLPKLCGIQAELSLTSVYEGETDFLVILQQLERAGFSVVDFHRGLEDPLRHELLQMDCVLFRTDREP